MPEALDPAVACAQIAALTDAALCGDWQSGAQASVLRAMGCSVPKAKDVPVAMEMVALLQHFAPRLAVRGFMPDEEGPMPLTPAVAWEGSRALLLVDVPAGAFEEIAYWVADRLPSGQIKAMPGILALPFTVEPHGAGPVLFPDWFAVFYPGARREHAFPILALQSALAHEAIGADWVAAALGRMDFYGLPRKPAAQQAPAA